MSPFGDVPLTTMFLAAAVASVLLAVVGTWPVCALLLRGYRRSIKRGMKRRTLLEAPAAPQPIPLEPSPAPATAAHRIALRPVAPQALLPLLIRAGRRRRHAQLAFLLLGMVYGAGSAAAYHIVNQMEWRPIRLTAYTLLLGWPVLPTMLSLSLVRRSRWWLAYAGYLAVVMSLLALAGVPTSEVLVMAIPALFVLATGAPSLRGTAWLVAPALMVVGLATAALYPVLVYLNVGVTFDRYAWSLLAFGGGLLVALVGYGWLVGQLYAAKLASDQTLLILQWWFVTSLCWTLLLGTQGSFAALLGMAPYAVVVLVLLLAALLSRDDASPPVRLLLLRTFGSRQRSSRLLHDLGRQWRWVGSVELITGTDLASEILEPDEFLDYIRGKLSRRFVQDESSLQRRLDELDLRPDRDGRYRVNELLCHEDTWRPAVRGLLGHVDAVLLDLRGFSAGNTGVVHELEVLVARMPLERVVVLVDPTTDWAALEAALDRAAALAPPSAPLLAGSPGLSTVALGLGGTDETRLLVQAVAQAAGSGGDRRGARPDRGSTRV